MINLNYFFSEKGHVATILGFFCASCGHIDCWEKVGNLLYLLHGHEKVLSKKILFMNTGCTILYNVAKLSNYSYLYCLSITLNVHTHFKFMSRIITVEGTM